MMTVEMADAVVAGGRRRALEVTALYDERCPLCRRLRDWLSTQATLQPVRFVAADSDEARRWFPSLDHARTTRVLTVVTSDGAVYEGERAWLVCAWALPRWRGVSERAGSPAKLRLVRVATTMVDGYRHRLLRRSSCGHCDLTAPR
jgi:predicted DCC family thiol-disulfide oxidoreductase YuxK